MPVLSGVQLIKLLLLDGWVFRGTPKANHGLALSKFVDGRNLVAIVPYKTDDLPAGTLHGILSVKQTRIGKQGLMNLIKKHGIPANVQDLI